MKIFRPITPILLAAMFFTLFAAANEQLKWDYSGDDHSTDSKQSSTIPVQRNRVHRAGLFWLNMNNTGYFGNPDGLRDPCTGRTAISGELPGGSGTDFIFVSSLIFGGYLDSATVNVGDTPAKVFQGPLTTTAYEGWQGTPMPREMWPINFDDDPSGAVLGRIYESSDVEGRVSCLFEEVYDPSATAEEQFSIMYTDKFVQQTPFTGMDDYDERQHIPLGIEVRQKSYAWSYDYAQKFIIIDYTLYNRNDRAADIYNFFMGVYLDPDIGNTSGISPGSGMSISANHADDIGGFIQKWEYFDDATGTMKVADLNLAWAADNDGRNYTGTNHYTATGQPGAGEPLDGATSILGVRVLRNPNPSLRFAYNIYIAHSDDESQDWGPRWQTGLHPRPAEDHPDWVLPHERREDPRSKPWLYDLTMKQLGYDDTNRDELLNDSSQPLYGGRTEGRPIGDRGKYMLMSNDEFDYDQIDIREIYKDVYTDPDYVEEQFAQADKWQRWTTSADLGNTAEGFSGDIIDGDIKAMNDIASGKDVKAILSFGPLGYEDYEDIAFDPNADWEPQSVLSNKKVWKFAHGDSLKLTLAFIVNENFHTSLDQDPNYADDTVVNLDDGLQKEYFQKGWYDALYNVVWAERVYDIPMYDTPVTRDGVRRGDGWYGEDVGKDGMFGDLRNDTFCWWFNEEYPGPDDGEGNFELDNFTAPKPDIYGFEALSEDQLLPLGRQHEDEDEVYGVTERFDGTGYPVGGWGYMIKYDKLDGYYPQGTWVRHGFDDGKLTLGDGVPDFTGPPPPPSPNIKISYLNDDVIIEWQSHEFFFSDAEAGYEAYIGPEHFVDPFTRVHDFEGYQIQISPDLNSQNYSEIFGVDRVNYIYENAGRVGDYLDSPFSENDKDSLIDEGLQTISAEGKIWNIVPYGNNTSISENHSQTGVYTYTSEQDSRIITVAEGVTETVDYWKYRFVLHNRLLAKQNYIAVTATDFGDPKSGTPALKSNPAVNGTSVIPTTLTGTDDVVVVPNPYRGDVDYETMGWENVGMADEWKEQDRKIVFMNVPVRSVLRIYTLAGDLVKTIGHNGNARVDERYFYGERGIAWDLINENNQAVVSGIYLYSVQDVDDSGYEHIGKFVIIK